jgi:hypothetical protein
MTVAETIIRIMARVGLVGEGAAMVKQGCSVEDAYRVAELERKLRRNMRKAGRQYVLDG